MGDTRPHLVLREFCTASHRASSAVMNTVGDADACSGFTAGGMRARAVVLATTWLPRLPLARPKTASPAQSTCLRPGTAEGAQTAMTPAQLAPAVRSSLRVRRHMQMISTRFSSSCNSALQEPAATQPDKVKARCSRPGRAQLFLAQLQAETKASCRSFEDIIRKLMLNGLQLRLLVYTAPGGPGSPGYMPSTLSTSRKLSPTADTATRAVCGARSFVVASE